jgi:hypothetical protein
MMFEITGERCEQAHISLENAENLRRGIRAGGRDISPRMAGRKPKNALAHAARLPP